MESIESFFILLSLKFNLSLDQFLMSCTIHNSHGTALAYRRQYGSSARPSYRSLLAPEVADFLDFVMSNETALWRAATDIHQKQLWPFGMTIDDAKSTWHNICARKTSFSSELKASLLLDTLD
eukprot:CAMPEP_0185040146 /NCGR_PEP_ID=MMETSP1103-20130426/37869_1 /TAXON_ID=36769 /ORGANISM="Paraphysomonas bandaiensis, Strain Caron Lab Isolate" /LENGTH=122 /DNA_ID=CAMNT_0027579327 /DNA_START=799 /DNA_END=1164 /DNA_ORIENTATION=-